MNIFNIYLNQYKKMTYNSDEIEKKRDFLFKEADFIMENEELFKTGTFSLTKKIEKQLEFNNISLKEEKYIIKKKKIEDFNIEALEKNIIKKNSMNLDNLTSFNIRRKSVYSINFNELSKKNSIDMSKNTSTKKVNFLITENNFEPSLLTNKLKKIKNKRKNLSQYNEQTTTKSSNFLPNLSSNKEESTKKNKLSIPKKFSVSLKKKPKKKLYKTIDTEKLIDDLKRTQLKFILKNQKKLNKEKKDVTIEFNDALNNYFKSHKHHNYFTLSSDSQNDRFVQTINEYEKSKKIFPIMKNAINEMELIEGENEKRKIRVSDHIYCISENLNHLRDKQKKNISDKNNYNMSRNSRKIRLKTTFIQRNLDPLKQLRKRNKIDLMINDIEKENDLVNNELKNWKKV